MKVRRADSGSAAIASDVKNSGLIDRMRATRRSPRSGRRGQPQPTRRSPPRAQLRRRSPGLVFAETVSEGDLRRRGNLILAVTAETVCASVLGEFGTKQAGKCEVEMVPARARAPFLGFVFPCALERIIQAVVTADDHSLDVRGRQAGEQRGARGLRALLSEPAPFPHALEV